MLIERLIFNMLAFSLLVIIVMKMIRKNDNIYFFVIGVQALGIIISFLELANNIFEGIGFKVFAYLISVIIPLVIIILEYRKIYFSELAYILMSKLAYLNKEYKVCKKILDKLIKASPESYYGHKMLATLYEKEGGLRKAIDEYVKLVELKKNDYESYYKIGFLLDELHKKDEAVTILTNLLRKKPDFYKASELLGIVLCDQEKFKQAAAVYQDALKYNPLSYELYYNLAIVHTRLNDFGSAKECYEKAADINHDLYGAYYSLGQIHLIYHDMDSAEEAFTKSLYGAETESKAYYQLAKIYLVKGDKEKAVSSINHAIKLDKSYIENVKKENVFEPIKNIILDDLEITQIKLEEVIPDEEEIEEEKEEEIVNQEETIEEHLNETLEIVKNLQDADMEIEEEKTEMEDQIKLDVLDVINDMEDANPYKDHKQRE